MFSDKLLKCPKYLCYFREFSNFPEIVLNFRKIYKPVFLNGYIKNFFWEIFFPVFFDNGFRDLYLKKAGVHKNISAAITFYAESR